ncbi:hypothetical protein PHLCEN_2v6938 [Hermanssonia centrifuga]|uniref:Uncharacterized protein n=1 Tax=Hermanssonia centrifuga TaxID=98765 RepID=A0A2R6NY26_9APHY|nr:hypothetical protein PHLCEN_2v6938 [Hermanssonia centrifuga]
MNGIAAAQERLFTKRVLPGKYGKYHSFAGTHELWTLVPESALVTITGAGRYFKGSYVISFEMPVHEAADHHE